MANYILTPNMLLIEPTPLVQNGPEWATNINTSLSIIDSHDHSPGSGVQITPTGININADLNFNDSNNLINARSLRLFPNASALAGASDLGCLYEAGVDLYYNDGSGNQIRITQSGSVAGSAGTITGLPSGTASASYVGSSGSFIFQQATSTAANLDVGSVAIRYPGSYPSPSGNYIQLQAPSSLASGYAITLPGLPSQTNVMTIGSTGILSSVTWDSVGVNMTSTGANAIASSMTSSGANAIGSSMTSTGANAIANSMTSTGANAIASTMSNPNFGGSVAKTNGHNMVASAVNASSGLRVVRGIIFVVASGGSITAASVIAGEGFSVTSLSGGVVVTYSVAFSDNPAKICISEGAHPITYSSVGFSGCTLGLQPVSDYINVFFIGAA